MPKLKLINKSVIREIGYLIWLRRYNVEISNLQSYSLVHLPKNKLNKQTNKQTNKKQMEPEIILKINSYSNSSIDVLRLGHHNIYIIDKDSSFDSIYISL